MGHPLNKPVLKQVGREAIVFLPVAALFFAGAVYVNARYDDAYIAYRYAENIANGYGPVYNIGERVEGYTCILWLLILAGVIKLGLNVARMSVALGIGFGWLTILATSWLAYQLSGDTARWRRWLPSVLLALCPLFAFSAGTGIETTLATFLVTAALGFVLYERDSFCAPVLFGLASLARPDTVLYAGVAFVYDLGVRKWKKGLLRTLPVVLLFGGQIIFRLIYYGDLFPNTYYSRLGSSMDMLVRGLWYTDSFIRFWWDGPVDATIGKVPWFVSAVELTRLLRYVPVVAIVAAGLFHKNRSRFAFILGVVLVHVLYVIRVGGDFMVGARFFIPILPALLVLTTESVVVLTEKIRVLQVRHVLRLVSVALILTVLATQVRPARAWRTMTREFNLRKMDAAQYFLEKFPPDSLIATDAIGIIGYITKMPILDVLGTVDRHIGHAKVPMGKGLPGHEKYDADYVFERNPDVIYIPLSPEGRWIILPVWKAIWNHPLLLERYEVVRDKVPYYRRKNVLLIPPSTRVATPQSQQQ